MSALVGLVVGLLAVILACQQGEADAESLQEVIVQTVEGWDYESRYHNFDDQRAGWLGQRPGTVRVPLYVNNPKGIAFGPFPVGGGVPFPRSELRSVQGVGLVDDQGQPLLAQFHPLSHWDDGSIQWLRVDTALSFSGSERQAAFLEYGIEDRQGAQGSSLVVEEGPVGVTVDTGVLKFLTGRKGFRLLDRVWIDRDQNGQYSDTELIGSGSDLVVVFEGEKYRSSLDQSYTLTVEERGPVKTVIRAEGWYLSPSQKRFCRFIVRISAFAGQSHVQVAHTFIYTGYPENRQHYLYRDKKLPSNEAPEAILLETDVSLQEDVIYSYGADGRPVVASNSGVTLFQNTAETFELESGDRTSTGGQKLDGWFDVSDTDRGLSVIVRDFWQQHPKSWRVTGESPTMELALWPQAAGVLDLSTSESAKDKSAAGRGSAFGLAKTHQLYLWFHGIESAEDSQSSSATLPDFWPLLSASPEWIEETVAVGKIRARRPKVMKSLEQGLEGIFDWAARQVRDNGWYGMIDFGGTLSRYLEKEDESGWFPQGRWGWMNNEAMGLHSGSLLQYLRTGDEKYLELGRASAAHIMDVDTVHFNTVAEDKRLRGVIPDDFSQIGSQHRHNADHWGGRNEETSHTNLHGILLYHYMTGDERALEVAKEIGEFLLQERVTYYGHPENCPQRNISNLLWGTIELYEATGDEKYKIVADRWARVLHDGQLDDGTWREKYNPVSQSWEDDPKDLFTLQYTLPALVAHHRVTRNSSTAAAIVKATEYYIENRSYNPLFEALSYSYFLTGDKRFLRAADSHVDYFLSKQRRSEDPMEDGMIFSKPTFLRPVEFLYQLPFAFESLSQKSGEP